MATKADQAITPAGKLFAEQNAIFDELEAQEEALMAPIREKLEVIRTRSREVSDEYAEKIGKALESLTLEDLSDPLRAVELHEASWNNALGVPGGSAEIYQGVAQGTYLKSATSYGYGYGNGYFEESRLYYTAPQVSIPKATDEATLARTAEVLEPIHRANMEIVGESTDARISILEDSCGYYADFHITYDSEDGLWTLHGGGGREFKTLLEALQAAPTYS